MLEAPTPVLDAEAVVLIAEQRLRGCSWLVLQEVACCCAGGMLRLTGRVPTYFLKQVASAAVSNIAGVSQVVNDIEVVNSSRHVLGQR